MHKLDIFAGMNFGHRLFFLVFLLMVFNITVKAQGLSFEMVWLSQNGMPAVNAPLYLRVSVAVSEKGDSLLYSEIQNVKTDSQGKFRLLAGSGRALSGSFNSITWTDTAFFLLISADTNAINPRAGAKVIQVRQQTVLHPDNLELMFGADTSKTSGTVVIPHRRNQRARKITVDLTSHYANNRYPGNTYPVYRHCEWFDDDRNGTGNALVLSYSDFTTHLFFEQSKKLGEVKLYNEPFQELFVESGMNEIVIQLTNARPIENVGETYAMKGPWKMICFVEW